MTPQIYPVLVALGLAVAAVLSSGGATAQGRPGAGSIEEGAAAAARGDWESAIEAFTSALRDQAMPPGRRVEALQVRAESWLRLGFVDKSIGDLQSALKLVPAGSNVTQEIVLHGTLGNAYLAAGQADAAEREFAASLRLSQSSGDRRMTAINEVNLGLLHGIKGQPTAEGELGAAIARADSAGDALLAAKAAIGAGRLAVKRDDLAAAERFVAAARGQLARSAPSHDQAYALIATALLIRSVEDRRRRSSPAAQEAVYTALNQAGAWAERAGDARALSYAQGYMAQLYEARGRRAEAQELTDRAIAAVNSVDAPEILYLWYWQTGRLQRDSGDIESAIAAYRRAIGALQIIRSDLTLDALGGKLSFREVVGPIFLEFADLLLRRPPGGAAAAQDRLVEARLTLETLKGAELQDYFTDDCIASLQARERPIDRLADDTAAIYPIVLPDRLELLVSLSDGIRQITVPVAGDAVTRSAADLRRLLVLRTTNQYLTESRRLYDWLIRPIDALLRQAKITTLVIIPDGALRTVPLAVLNDGRAFLISRFALVVTPGLTLMDPRPLPRQNVEVLLGGLTEAVQGFPPLPNVADELAGIRTHFAGRVLADLEFRTASIGAALKKTAYTIVHFASHGEFVANGRDSFILTYDGRLTMDGLEQDVKYGRFRPDPVELLTLSACSTAEGDDRAALGLAGVAIKAGARSALATLWEVSDGAAAILVSDFYRRLKDTNMSKAAALQAAQLAMLNGAKYRHPSFWAPFLMIGNWL